MMKSLFVILGLSLALGAAWAGPQQDKMKHCNAMAKEQNLAGDERKAHMKSCLSAKGDAASASAPSQRDKMKTCNADAKAKNLAGDERKAFMADCLKAK